MVLPQPFAAWFAWKGWVPRRHQLELVAQGRAGRSSLLIAPTGAGKTLAGFLPSLIDLNEKPRNRPGLHTLYISPLKALAVDIARNLSMPVERWFSPSASKRARATRRNPAATGKSAIRLISCSHARTDRPAAGVRRGGSDVLGPSLCDLR